MPRTTIRPSSASFAAAEAARPKAAASGMRWSDGITITTAVGSRRSARQAASATAASVSRPWGSSAISMGMPSSAAWSAIMNRDGWPLMTMGVPKISRGSRPRVRWNGEAPPSIGTCCLANSLRDTGQSREPEPPQRMAGTIRPWVEALAVPGMGESDVMGYHLRSGPGRGRELVRPQSHCFAGRKQHRAW